MPTPDWVVAADSHTEALPPPYIIKAIWEHASLGLDDHAVIREGDGTTICDQIESRSRQLGQACFAEAYIEGREFNLSLIATGDGPRFCRRLKSIFQLFLKGNRESSATRPNGKPVRWNTWARRGSSIFRPTTRRCSTGCGRWPCDAGSRSIYPGMRVDFRVDERGRPWILEINANPCLSPDAGFAAALATGQHAPGERGAVDSG